ncbi:MAG: thiamine pyrophosphate-binding protein, partial [Alphaproteobacteria bacterium]|nr:thiamine pyrophosphate-binding protein [Alphaproteobacteria bacterium]
RKLDYQLGFGSPAVFPDARFLRIAATPAELIDNRRGTPEVLASVDLALEAITDALGNDPGSRDDNWVSGLQTKHRERIAKGAATPAPKT